MESYGAYSFVWFTSLSIMFARSIHLAMGSCCSFTLIAVQFSMVWIYHNGFIYSTVVEHLAVSNLGLLKSVLPWTFVCMSLVHIWVHSSVGYVPGVEILGHGIMHMARLSRSYYLFKVVVLIYIPSRSVWKLLLICKLQLAFLFSSR